MTVREIVRAWLKERGIAGLCNEECGCGVDALAPCEAMLATCREARRCGAFEAGVCEAQCWVSVDVPDPVKAEGCLRGREFGGEG